MPSKKKRSVAKPISKAPAPLPAAPAPKKKLLGGLFSKKEKHTDSKEDAKELSPLAQKFAERQKQLAHDEPKGNAKKSDEAKAASKKTSSQPSLSELTKKFEAHKKELEEKGHVITAAPAADVPKKEKKPFFGFFGKKERKPEPQPLEKETRTAEALKPESQPAEQKEPLKNKDQKPAVAAPATKEKLESISKLSPSTPADTDGPKAAGPLLDTKVTVDNIKGLKKAPAPTQKHANDARRDFLAVFRKEKPAAPKELPLPKKKKSSISKAQRKRRLTEYMERAGFRTGTSSVTVRIFKFCIIANIFISIGLIYFYIPYGLQYFGNLALTLIVSWITAFALLFVLTWIGFFVVIDLKIFKRTKEIESFLADYLQLTASNIKAGMTIDRALWYAVRPRFGALAQEIEIVAKETLAGVDLKIALNKFAKKYNSPLLRRSISLLIEGVDSGGEIGTLLQKIAINIQETKIMQREMSSSVTTYVIFISFATLFAAPGLFALSGVLIQVIGTLGASFGDIDTSGLSLSLSFSDSGIALSDFRIFAVLTLAITSIFSGLIIASIRTGTPKYGFKYVPAFIAATTVIYFILDYLMGGFLGFFF